MLKNSNFRLHLQYDVALLLDEGPSMCDLQHCLYNTPVCILLSEEVLQNLRNVLSAK